MSTEADDPYNGWACGVCAQPLSAEALGGEVVSWLHLGDMPGALPEMAVDHPAVPVRAEEIHTASRCDFCSGPRPTFVLPVEEFEVQDDRATTRDWLACEVCARLLRKKRWDDLTERCVRALASTYRVDAGDPRLAVHVKALHAQVREYQTGPVRRLD